MEGEDIYSWYLKEWAGVDPQNGDPLWYVVDDKGDTFLTIPATRPRPTITTLRSLTS
jgi:hypothetical protein